MSESQKIDLGKFDKSTICQPIYVYAIIAIIMALCCLSIAIAYGNYGSGFAGFLGNLVWILICCIILWLICNFIKDYGITIAWIIVVIIILLNLSAIAGYLSNSILPN